jgi:hypothetical protein
MHRLSSLMLTTFGGDRRFGARLQARAITHLVESRQDVAHRQVGFALVKPIDRGTEFKHKG